MEADEEEEEECLERYKATGSKRVFVLAEVQGVPENRKNYEIIIKSLNMASLGDDIQIVCDLKLVSILLGIQTATAMHLHLHLHLPHLHHLLYHGHSEETYLVITVYHHSQNKKKFKCTIYLCLTLLKNGCTF